MSYAIRTFTFAGEGWVDIDYRIVSIFEADEVAGRWYITALVEQP
jgi:hypothetical protein